MVNLPKICLMSNKIFSLFDRIPFITYATILYMVWWTKQIFREFISLRLNFTNKGFWFVYFSELIDKQIDNLSLVENYERFYLFFLDEYDTVSVCPSLLFLFDVSSSLFRWKGKEKEGGAVRVGPTNQCRLYIPDEYGSDTRVDFLYYYKYYEV